MAKPVSIGTPKSAHATRVLMLGSGELGKEVVIELQRFGVEVIACDRYADAPAMQVAHRSHVLDMLDRAALRAVVEKERPHLIVPEIEAIATQELLALEAEGWTVIPTAQAARLTMDREAIRRVAAEQLDLPTARYQFADTYAELQAAARPLGSRRDQAHHVVVGQRPIRRQDRGRSRTLLAVRADRRPDGRGPRHRRRIHPLRIRDHAPHRPLGQRHFVL
jgi:hypothetical protein